jgi:hypothetical protein
MLVPASWPSSRKQTRPYADFADEICVPESAAQRSGSNAPTFLSGWAISIGAARSALMAMAKRSTVVFTMAVSEVDAQTLTLMPPRSSAPAVEALATDLAGASWNVCPPLHWTLVGCYFEGVVVPFWLPSSR